MRSLAAAVIAAFLATPASAGAQQPAGDTGDRWQFLIAPYFWASSLAGRSATLPPLPPADIDVSFGDIMRNLDIGLMGAGEARRGRFGLMLDFLYSSVSGDGSVPGTAFSGANVRSRSYIGSFSTVYRVFERGPYVFDAGAGVRVWWLSTRLELLPGTLPGAQRTDNESWADPLIAARAIVGLGSGFSATLIADIGGFGAGSRLTWQIMGLLNYSIGQS